jgi:hypothetical protein
MFRRTRSLTITMLLAMLLIILVACGGSSGSSSAPEERLKAFYADLNSAMNDPGVADPARQEEWAEKISRHYQPSEQATQKEATKNSLIFIAEANGSMTIDGLTTEKISEEGDNAVIRITGGRTKVSLGDQNTEQNLVDSTSGADDGTIKLKKIDGVWYLTSDK